MSGWHGTPTGGVPMCVRVVVPGRAVAVPVGGRPPFAFLPPDQQEKHVQMWLEAMHDQMKHCSDLAQFFGVGKETTDPKTEPEQEREHGQEEDEENSNSSGRLPILVNPRQYKRILARREQRAQLEARYVSPQSSQTFVHESRHKHAMRRPRGPGGRFLTREERMSLEDLPEAAKDPGSEVAQTAQVAEGSEGLLEAVATAAEVAAEQPADEQTGESRTTTAALSALSRGPATAAATAVATAAEDTTAGAALADTVHPSSEAERELSRRHQGRTEGDMESEPAQPARKRARLDGDNSRENHDDDDDDEPVLT